MFSRARRFIISCSAIFFLLAPLPLGSLVGAARAARPALPGEHFTQGAAWTGEPGVSVKASALMAMPAPQGERLEAPEFEAPEKEAPPVENHLPTVKQDISGLFSQQPPRVAQTPGTQIAGTSLSDFRTMTGSALTPPDTMGAVGPSEFFVALNTLYTSYNKTNGQPTGFNLPQDNFWNSVRGSSYTTDPRVRYDRLSGRWFVIAITIGLPNRIMIAVSNGSEVTPSTVWTYYQFTHSAVSPAGDSDCLADYPTLGVDSNALYIGVNNFCGSSLNNATYRNSTGFVVKKSSLLAGGSIKVTAFRGISAAPAGQKVGTMYTPQGVDNYASNASEGYFLAVDASYYSSLTLRRVINPGTDAPSISDGIAITVPTTSSSINVPHLGNTGGASGYLDSVPDRLLAAQLRGSGLWTAQTIGVDAKGNAVSNPSRDAVRWYQLNINSPASPTVAQSGTIYDGSSSSPRFFFLPSINVTGQGHAAVGYSFAGASSYIGSLFSGRMTGDDGGLMTQGAVLVNGGGAYNPTNDPGGQEGRRWGDYSYTSVDPCDDMTLWTVQEYARTTNDYAVWVSKLVAPPPPASISFSPASVAAGQASASVTVIGASVNQSGFFDPGEGFACRLAASIPGVKVNSVTYVDPTHVKLSLDTTGAQAGAHTLTIANPDGQATSGALQIDGAGAVLNKWLFLPILIK